MINNLIPWEEVEKKVNFPQIRLTFLGETFPASQIVKRRKFIFFYVYEQMWDLAEIEAWCEETKLNPKLQWGISTKVYQKCVQSKNAILLGY